jgi:hypothetical protein
MHLVLLLAMFFPSVSSPAPAPAHGGIAGASRGGGIAPTHWPRPQGTLADPRDLELAGQIRLLDRRIDRLRDSGQISRREARDMRREAHAIAASWWRLGSDGLSASEADELQHRLLAADSRALPSRAPR